MFLIYSIFEGKNYFLSSNSAQTMDLFQFRTTLIKNQDSDGGEKCSIVNRGDCTSLFMRYDSMVSKKRWKLFC